MGKRILVVFMWFIGAWITYGATIITIANSHNPYSGTIKLVEAKEPEIISTAPPQTEPIRIKDADARPILLARFLAFYKSPLKPYDYWGMFLVNLADQHQLDYRLLPSISMQESNLCKVIPEGTYNCLGLGIHKSGTWGFDRYEDNFAAAAAILKKNYIDKGYVKPEEIQKKYTPGSNGSWQFAVNHFMDKISQGNY